MGTASDFPRLRLRAAILSLSIGFVMLGLKVGAYLLTDSSAILSDALESVVHVVATAFVLFSVVLAARPPDASHPYGHGKVEYFSAGFEGALIMLAALAIFYDATHKLLYPAPPSSLDVGTLMITVAGAINLFLGAYLIRIGRRTHSIALVADGKHVLTDSYTSLAVLVGLILILLTGWTILDPLVALLVGVNILVAGGRLVYQSVRGLMDTADPETLTAVVDALESARKPGWIDVHRLRALQIGDSKHVDLHLTVPRFWDVDTSHDEQEQLAEVINSALPGRTGLLAHLDPCTDACCSFCSFEPCAIRALAFTDKRPWNLQNAVSPAHYPPDNTQES
jgi:cation diffusion facilitator family transporter